jgi:hypothetical protein
MPSNGGSRRVRVERGVYQQPNGKYAVCVRVDGRARFRTVEAATLLEAVQQRELLQRAGQVGDLPLSPRLTFAEVAGRWLAEFEVKAAAGERRDRTLDLYRSQLDRHLLPRLGKSPAGADHNRRRRHPRTRVAGVRSFALDGQADPRRAHLRLHVRASSRFRQLASLRPARARRAPASTPIRSASPHPDGARPTFRGMPAAIPAAASHRRVHGHAALRSARPQLGRRRLRRRRDPRPSSARPRATRRPTPPHPPEDARLGPRSPTLSPARRRSPPAQTQLQLHAWIGLRVRDQQRHPRLSTTTSPSGCSAAPPPVRDSTGRSGRCASTISATPSPAT